MEKFSVIGIGEILWDILPDGKQLGGAPANVAFHAQNLGADSTIISAIGDDKLGSEIKQVLRSRKLINILNLRPKPSGTVTVELHKGIPGYVIHENVAWDEIMLNEVAKAELLKADALCFGTLAQRSVISRHAIRKALEMVPKEALKVFDINLRQNYYSRNLIRESLQLANVLKLNSDELVIVRDYFSLNSDDDIACSELIDQFDLRLVALTNGSKNSMLITKNDRSVISTPKTKTADTIGAGDSFTATMVMGLLNREALTGLHQKAVNYSAKVCMSKGATPIIEI
jgi:fructokinase